MRLEGHADERGSREYNIGLGERRGQAVRRALLLQGVAEVQLSTVSYGEERPAVAGSDEQAYAPIAASRSCTSSNSQVARSVMRHRSLSLLRRARRSRSAAAPSRRKKIRCTSA